MLRPNQFLDNCTFKFDAKRKGSVSHFNHITMAELNPFLLAAVTPEPDPRLLPLLRSKPALASSQDAHGYSLLHAAASYNHRDLLRTLVNEFKVDVNLKDEDHETCLFVTETVQVAKCLVEELHIDLSIRNEEDMTALEKFASEDEFPEITAYLQAYATGNSDTDVTTTTSLPPLPPNMTLNINPTPQISAVEGQEPDPEFRRRIEELAAKENFHTEEGQRELRQLITDAVKGVNDDRDVRRRID